MTEDEFWGHIRATRRAAPDEHGERLTARLAMLPEGEILDFAHLWEVAVRRAYRRDLWGAAYLINGGASDDGFEYFCRWLVLQGRKVFEAAVADPDSLAGVLGPDADEVECECYPGADAWFAATRTEPDDAGYAALHAALRARPSRAAVPRKPRGRRWDFDDDAQVRRRLPRLAARFLDGDD
jgi:hypothetical protein